MTNYATPSLKALKSPENALNVAKNIMVILRYREKTIKPRFVRNVERKKLSANFCFNNFVGLIPCNNGVKETDIFIAIMG